MLLVEKRAAENRVDDEHRAARAFAALLCESGDGGDGQLSFVGAVPPGVRQRKVCARGPFSRAISRLHTMKTTTNA